MTDLPIDTNPPLAVRVVPPHRERWDRVGRLYRKPDFVLPEDFAEPAVLRELLRNGDLMPSVTNVIGVKNSPYLLPWATKKVAEEAVRVTEKFPGLISNKPERAVKYLKDAAEREKNFWANQGTRVHLVNELIGRKQEIPELKLTDYENACVDAFKSWLDIFQPQMNYLELTGYGKTNSGLWSAGTSDFHATINGVNILGDYKCVTDETPVLLANGSEVNAKDLNTGDLVVAWDEETGLHSAEVTYVGDNGTHPIMVIRGENGQELQCTTNHPILILNENGSPEWKNAEDVKPGDTAYVATGWSYSPYTMHNPWNYNKHLSPYLLGMLWALSHFAPNGWTESGRYAYPAVSRSEMFEELASFGFLQSKDGRLRIKVGLQRVAKKTKISIDELLDIINSPRLPDGVLSSPVIFQQAFISGVQEVFTNRELNQNYYFVDFANIPALRSLQQLYSNLGTQTKLGFNQSTKRPMLRVTLGSSALNAYGTDPTTITFAQKAEQEAHTVAIEVAGAHTHITGGFVTHNTNRSGLHDDIALQLAANRNMEEVTVDSETLIPAPATDMTVGLHLSPEGFKMKEVESGPVIFDTYTALRDVWDFAVFDGKMANEKGVFLRTIKTLKDL